MHIISINSDSALTNYINYRSAEGTSYNYRSDDKITKFVVFSHGWKGTLALGFNYGDYDTSLDYDINDIKDIQSNAFSDPNSWFYACNTATGGDDSFLKAWHNKVGGFAGGYASKTDYKYITYSEAYFGYWYIDPRKWSEKSLVEHMRKKYGFSVMGSLRYPIRTETESQTTYR